MTPRCFDDKFEKPFTLIVFSAIKSCKWVWTLVLSFRMQNVINVRDSSTLSQKLSEVICEMAQEIGGFKFEEVTFFKWQ